MFQRILVVMENLETSQRALDYARELALRMDAEVGLLMLAEMNFPQRPGLAQKRKDLTALEQSAGELLSEIAADFLGSGLTTGAALRVGDPAQELAKYLAGHPPYQVVIWGSDDSLPGGSKRHWMGHAAGFLECPLLTVSSRNKPKSKV